jgi:hypothetical protein
MQKQALRGQQDARREGSGRKQEIPLININRNGKR